MLCDVLTCSVQLGAEGGDPVGQAALSLSLNSTAPTTRSIASLVTKSSMPTWAQNIDCLNCIF